MDDLQHNLYIVKVPRKTLYFLGSIPPSKYEAVQTIAKEIWDEVEDDYLFSREFIKRLSRELYIKVGDVKPDNIFKL